MVLYHFTRRIDLPKVLSEGLRPSSETGNRSVYGGFSGNPDYIYFYSREAMRRIARNFCLGFDPSTTVKNMVLLRVEIDDSSVERDYDQLLTFIQYAKSSAEWQRWLLSKAAGWGTKLTGFTEAGVRDSIDCVAESSWRLNPGAYRTRIKRIPNVVITSWTEFLNRRTRILGALMRPCFRIKRLLKK